MFRNDVMVRGARGENCKADPAGLGPGQGFGRNRPRDQPDRRPAVGSLGDPWSVEWASCLRRVAWPAELPAIGLSQVTRFDDGRWPHRPNDSRSRQIPSGRNAQMLSRFMPIPEIIEGGHAASRA